jgi:serine/threonine-protein kinase HipA
MPVLEIGENRLLELVHAAVSKGFTIPGIQKKLSLHLSGEPAARLTSVDYATGYILKPQTEEYRSLPEFEDLAMRLAETAGIKTVPHALIKLTVLWHISQNGLIGRSEAIVYACMPWKIFVSFQTG